MPYYMHKIGSEPETGERFDTKQDALSARTDGYTVTRVLTADEKTAWRDRESARFDDGTYVQSTCRNSCDCMPCSTNAGA